jgi:hypothetical protein
MDSIICNCLAITKSLSFFCQDSEGQGCPFCRCEIKGTEQVVVDPFDEPKPKNEERPLHSPHIDNEDEEPVSIEPPMTLYGSLYWSAGIVVLAPSKTSDLLRKMLPQSLS